MMIDQQPQIDWAELRRKANANLRDLSGRVAREKAAKLERQQRKAENKKAEQEERRKYREWKRNTKADLKEITKLCNQYDRKMMSKVGLTPEEHGAYEELDAMRWTLVRDLTGEDWR